MRPASEALPGFVGRWRRTRGKQKAPDQAARSRSALMRTWWTTSRIGGRRLADAAQRGTASRRVRRLTPHESTRSPGRATAPRSPAAPPRTAVRPPRLPVPGRPHHGGRREPRRQETTARWNSGSKNRNSGSARFSGSRRPPHKSLKNCTLIVLAFRSWDRVLRGNDPCVIRCAKLTLSVFRPNCVHGRALTGRWRPATAHSPRRRLGSPGSVVPTTPREEVLHA